MTAPGLASILFLTDPHYWAGIATAMSAGVAVYLARRFLPRQEAVSAAPPGLAPGPSPGPPPQPLLSDSCADYWETLTSPNGDRRGHPRRGGSPIQVQLLGPRGNQARPAYVLDRSKGGLRLLVEAPVPIGTALRARTADAPDNVPWVKMNVRWCSTNEDRHEIGCQFTEQPPGHVLLLFG